MDIRKIMPMALLLLAVLTIGAVSATDDVALDNLTVSDDSDIIADDDVEYGIEIMDEITDKEDEVAYITLPSTTTSGSFRILDDEDVIARTDVNLNDDEHWYTDDEDDEILYGSLYLGDLNLTNVKNNDKLSFKFFEVIDGNYVANELYTKTCKVMLTGKTIQLEEIDGEMAEEDVKFDVKNINPSKPDENFTYVYVTQKEGFFVISVELNDGDDDETIFKEDLKTTGRPYVLTDDGNGTQFYRFGFSFNDLNSYIAQHHVQAANSFDDLVTNNIISSGNEIYFELYEEEEEETVIDSETMTFTIASNGRILFESEEDDVEVDYGDEMNIEMTGNWQESEVLEFKVKKGLNGKIVIYLNNETSPAFEKAPSELTPFDDDEDFNYYNITIGDLGITQAGEYVIYWYFDDANGNHLYQYDEDDPETLVIYESQTQTVGNVTIWINPFPTIISENDAIITVSSNASEDDFVLIYVDGNETPFNITLGNCTFDDYGDYAISSKDLKLGVGQHNLRITYNNTDHTGTVTLLSNVVIEISPDRDTVYTTYNECFVLIVLEEGEIYGAGIEGKVNVTITDDDGNIIDTIEKNIEELEYNTAEEAYVIRTGNMKEKLNGTYNVTVRYFNGTEAETQNKGRVTFKPFEAKDYGAIISANVVTEYDYLLTFTAIPLSNSIIVETDGIKVLEISESNLEECYDNEIGEYYIKYDRIMGLSEGYHSIMAYIETEDGNITLASGTVLIDLEEDIDPALTVAVGNVQEGNAANAVITTDAAYTGEVIVQVGDKNYSVNVVSGKGSIPITGLKAGTYVATAIFKADGIFKESTKTSTFKITPKPAAPAKKTVIKLTLKKVKVKKSAKRLVLQATLKINGKKVKGKKIIFKFKGKTYRAKTNKKGVAKVTVKKKVLKKLKVGKKVTYTAKYSIKTVKRTVKVRK